MSKICKKRVHGNDKKNLPGDFKKCPGSLHFTLLTFHFFFGLCLGLRLFSVTDNLSKPLQSEKLSAVSSQDMASLTLKTLQNMRRQEDFELFFNLLPNKPRNYQLMSHILRGKGRCQSIPFFNKTTGNHKRSTPPCNF